MFALEKCSGVQRREKGKETGKRKSKAELKMIQNEKHVNSKSVLEKITGK